MKDFFSLKHQARFSAQLPMDSSRENVPRQVTEAAFSYVKTTVPKNPEIIHTSTGLLSELEIEIQDREQFLKVMSGSVPFPKAEAYAMCYGGHQFGNWAGQLGDGRAINIAELDINGTNWSFQLKGSGPTPYSRGADGFAVLRSSVREYLCSEAMHHLGIPTTRALSLAKSGDWVTRDMLYNGNSKDEQGAIVCRISPSFIRFGSFEIFSARNDQKNLKKLVDFTIENHYPHLGAPKKETYLEFFKEVTQRTKTMVLHWQRVGFVHGVMNTDNMSILGLTIDYGPYGWLENYDPGWTPNTTDIQNKRYRFGNQAGVALWNLTQLANAIFGLIEETEPLQKILDDYREEYLSEFKAMMLNKLGLSGEVEVSESFISDLQENMHLSEIDMTLFFRELSSQENQGQNKFWQTIVETSYLELNQLEKNKTTWLKWFEEFDLYIQKENADTSSRESKMKAINPKYVLRNYMAQMAIDDAEKGDYALIDELYILLQNPYDEQPKMSKWFAKRPDWAKDRVGCSMLSCSS